MLYFKLHTLYIIVFLSRKNNLFHKMLACCRDMRYNKDGSECRIIVLLRGARMSSRTDAEVVIGGKVLTLSGYESAEYLQKIGNYINKKLTEYSSADSFRRQPADIQNILLQLNIADDFFKAKSQISLLEEELEAKEKELYDLKHELISVQIKLENLQKQAKELQLENTEQSKKIVRLETELKDK